MSYTYRMTRRCAQRLLTADTAETGQPQPPAQRQPDAPPSSPGTAMGGAAPTVARMVGHTTAGLDMIDGISVLLSWERTAHSSGGTDLQLASCGTAGEASTAPRLAPGVYGCRVTHRARPAHGSAGGSPTVPQLTSPAPHAPPAAGPMPGLCCVDASGGRCELMVFGDPGTRSMAANGTAGRPTTVGLVTLGTLRGPLDLEHGAGCTHGDRPGQRRDNGRVAMGEGTHAGDQNPAYAVGAAVEIVFVKRANPFSTLAHGPWLFDHIVRSLDVLDRWARHDRPLSSL